MLAAACGPVVDAPSSNATASPIAEAAESSSDGESGESSPSDDPAPTTPSDASSECPFADGVAVVDPNAAYPFCQPDAPEAFTFYCARQPSSHGFWLWHADANGVTSRYCEGGDDCNACNCSVECRNDPDDLLACPDPPSGNALPTCFTWNGPDSDGQCFLDCGDGEACPDGMQCVDNLEAGMRVCSWITQDDRCERP